MSTQSPIDPASAGAAAAGERSAYDPASGDLPSATATPRSEVRRPGDADGDGMPDTWNARMPAVAFLLAMLTLLPTLFGLRATIGVLRHTDGGAGAYAFNITAVIAATTTIIAAAYGVRARTAGLARAGRAIAILQVLLALGLTVALFLR